MLVVGLVPTVSYDWRIINISDPNDTIIEKDEPTGWGIPARCFWLNTYGDGVNDDAPIGYILLVVSYAWKIGDVFASTRRLYSSSIRAPLETAIESILSAPARRYMRTRRRRHLWSFRLLLVPSIPLIILIEFFPRQQNALQTASREDEWGFGQLVPLVLLIQPLGALFEHIWVRHSRIEVLNSEEMVKHLPRPESVPTDRTVLAHDPRSGPEGDKLLIKLLGRERSTRVERTPPVDSRFEITRIVLSSRVGIVLLVLSQITLLGGTCAILYFDVVSIGIARGQGWALASLALVFHVASSWLAVFIASPWSRLGRDPFKYDALSSILWNVTV